MYNLLEIKATYLEYFIHAISFVLFLFIAGSFDNTSYLVRNEFYLKYLIPVFSFVVFFIMDTLADKSLNVYAENKKLRDYLKKTVFLFIFVIFSVIAFSYYNFHYYDNEMKKNYDDLFSPFFIGLGNNDFEKSYSYLSKKAKEENNKDIMIKYWDHYLSSKSININSAFNYPFIIQDVINYDGVGKNMKVNMTGSVDYGSGDIIHFWATILKEDDLWKFDKIVLED